MMTFIELPIKDPILLFSVFLFIILIAPALFRHLRIPGLIGLILAGVVLGPYGLNVISLDGRVELFGKIGLLYIMFLAGLELDLQNAIQNKNKSIVFGILTFIVPILIGFPVCYYFLHFSFITSLVVASMFSTHTLVAYPIVSRMGITRNEAVIIAVGGTIITDTAVLLLLAVITGAHKGDLSMTYWIRFVGYSILYILFIFGLVPIFARKFLRYIDGEKASQFIFILAVLFLSAFISNVIGIEAIVGAFFAGLALNRLIPHRSDLMNKVEFVGNALFIPFFLISVGMLVDLHVLFDGKKALLIAFTLVLVANFVKWLASYITQNIYNLSTAQRRLIWGLSNAHAAAIMAVAITCFQLKIIDEYILNATILLILVTCLIASFITENAARQIAIETLKHSKNSTDERILISSADDETYEWLMQIAIQIKDKENQNPIYPMAVIEDNDDAKIQIEKDKQRIEALVKKYEYPLEYTHIVTRIELNKVSAINRTVKEDAISDVLWGWSNKQSTGAFIFGTMIENLTESVWQNLYAVHLVISPKEIKHVTLILPANAEFEYGFRHMMQKFVLYINAYAASYDLYANAETLNYIQSEKLIPKTLQQKGNTILFTQWSDITEIAFKNSTCDLLVMMQARKGTVSYNIDSVRMMDKIIKLFEQSNFIFAYPEQRKSKLDESLIQANDIDTRHLEENLRRVDRLRKKVKEVFKSI